MIWSFVYFLDCHATLTKSYGEITSYGFPQGYYKFMDCTWLIQRSHGEVIEITEQTRLTQDKVTLDITGYASGIYFVDIVDITNISVKDEQ